MYIYLDPTLTITGVTVGTDPLNPDATLDSLSDYYLNIIRNQNNYTTVQNIKNVTLGGKPARTLTYQAVFPVPINQTAYVNVPIETQQTWTLNNGTGYLVSYKAPPSNFTKFQPEAQKIINSFQVT